MFTLNATNQTLEIVLGGLVTTNELPFVCAFADHDAGTPAFTPAPQDGISNGTTPVTVMGSPASGLQRQLKTLAVFNDDTVAAVVIFRFNNGGTIRPIFKTSVPAKGTFIYTDGAGPKVIDSGGNILIAPDAFVARTNVAETITAGWTFTQEIDAQAGIDISGGALKIGGSTVIDASENADFGGTLAVGGTVTFGTGVGGATANIDGAAGTERQIAYRTAGLLRWIFRCNSTAESSGNAGSDFEVARRSDAGADLGVGMLIKRNTGNFGVNLGSPTAQLHVLSGAAGRVGLIVDTAASPSAPVANFFIDGTIQFSFDEANVQGRRIILSAFDNGANRGREILLDRNNASVTPAAGHLNIVDAGGTGQFIWPDDSAATGNLRIGVTVPTNANDTSGAVVGDQTSWHELKEILGPALPAEDAVRSVAALVFEEFRFKERSRETWDGANQTFNGLVVRDRRNDWWGTNCAPNQIPALNEIELFARYGLTIQSLIAEVKALGGFAWL